MIWLPHSLSPSLQKLSYWLCQIHVLTHTINQLFLLPRILTPYVTAPGHWANAYQMVDEIPACTISLTPSVILPAKRLVDSATGAVSPAPEVQPPSPSPPKAVEMATFVPSLAPENKRRKRKLYKTDISAPLECSPFEVSPLHILCFLHFFLSILVISRFFTYITVEPHYKEADITKSSYTVEPQYNEVLGTMKFTLLCQVSHIRVKKQRTIKSWDQQNYLVIRGFCYIQPLYSKVPL